MKPTNEKETKCIHDVVVIGGGPAGLASAIYGSADGLNTLLISQEAPGGQCGRSSCIENFLGFPDGISGTELADRALAQARKFGCEVRIPLNVDGIVRQPYGFDVFTQCPHKPRHEADIIRTKTIVIATGLKLKKLGIENEDRCRANIQYYAAMSQGQRFEGKDIHIVGGANSAAQAAMYFSQFAKTVNLLVRGGNLSDSMSAYLERRLLAKKNIRIRYNLIVVKVQGRTRCESLMMRETISGDHWAEPTAALLVYAGSVPQTDFLAGFVARDEGGYVVSGPQLHNSQRFTLETSQSGIFVVGDVRADSPKGVSAGAGEGATAIKQIHEYFNEI